ncbi:MAG: DUF2934 domain-containing protein [Nibricoccus sp.]
MNSNLVTHISDEDVQKEAYLLYLASGCVPGRDFENWLEAQARLTKKAQENERSAAHTGYQDLHFPPSAWATRGPSGTFNPFSSRN